MSSLKIRPHFDPPFTYDPDTGQKITETNALGKVTQYAYNARGQIASNWGDSVYPAKYEYDALGHMISMTTYRSGSNWNGDTFPAGEPGDTTTWTYDIVPSPLASPEPVEGGETGASGLLIARTDPAGNAVTYTYDEAGRLETRTWARTENSNPLVTNYIHDPATGDLTGIDHSEATPDITYTYNRFGRLKNVTDATGNHAFEYANDLQLVSESISGLVNRTITRNYSASDVLGRSTGFNNGTYQVTYGYDSTGRMNQVGWDADGQTGAAAYTYVEDSDLLASVSINGNLNTTFSYEPHRDFKTQIQNTFGGQVVSQYKYEYDEVGRSKSVVSTGAAFSADAHNAYDYNDRDELIESSRFLGANPADASQPVTPEYRSYLYDAIGNRTQITEATNTETYTSNNLNEYIQQTISSGGSRSFNYDADGNMTSIMNNGSETIYTWDAENRLVAAKPKTPGEGGQKIEFVYDYMGRRVKKTISTYSSGSWILASEFFFVYDGSNLIEEITKIGATQTTRHFVWGLDLSQSVQGAGGAGGLLTAIDGSNRYLYCYDGNGSVGQVVNAANGEILAKYEYDPYGKPTKAQGDYALANPFRFSTKYHDDETSLVYYGYRYYSPELGRWMNQDPIGELGCMNLYNAFYNSPVDYYDPDGYYGHSMHLKGNFAVFMAAGMKDAQFAFRAAYYSDYTDIIDEYSATGMLFFNGAVSVVSNLIPGLTLMKQEYQEILHQLNGMDKEQRKLFRCCLEILMNDKLRNNDARSFGVLNHIFGDTYGHMNMYVTRDVEVQVDPQDYYETGGYHGDTKTYTETIGIADDPDADVPNYSGYGLGHAKDFKTPDNIASRPELAKSYLKKEFELVGGKDNENLNKVINKINELPRNATEGDADKAFSKLIQDNGWDKDLSREQKKYLYENKDVFGNPTYDEIKELPTITPEDMKSIIDEIKQRCLNN